jgi:hypothetical protein
MNDTLEDRLRRELTRTPDPRSDAAATSDEAILAEIQRRADAIGDNRNRNTPGPQRRGTFLVAVAAAVVALVGTIAALTGADGRSSLQTGPADSPADLAIGAPSPLWLVVIMAVGVAVAIPARRLRAGRLASIAVAVATLAIAIAVGSMLPSWHAAERLSTVLPELDGYEPVETHMNWWPTLAGYDQLRVDYRRADGQPITLSNNTTDGQRDAVTAELDILADQFGYNTGLPNLGRRCRQFQSQIDETPRRSLTEYDRRRMSDFFCLADIQDGQLMVTGTEYSANWLWFRWFLAIPLIGLAVLLAGLAATDQRRQAPPLSTGTQLAFGMVLLLLCGALFFTGIFAVDSVRVSGIEGLQKCQDSPEQVLNQSGSVYQTCRQYVVDVVEADGLTDQASRLYGPLVVLADMVAAVLVVFAAVIVGVLARIGQLPVGRRRLAILLVALSLLSVGVQAYHRDTIAVTTNAYE